MYIANLLKKTLLFAPLKDEEVEAAAGITTSKKPIVFLTGTVIFKEGEDDQMLYIVCKGRIRIISQIGEYKIPICDLGEGTFFGEMALLEKAPRSATAIAVEDSELLLISRANFFRFLESDTRTAARLLYNLTKLLSARIRASNKRLKQYVLQQKQLIEGEEADIEEELKTIFSTL